MEDKLTPAETLGHATARETTTAYEVPSVGPRCGNNPQFKLSSGDRAAVDEFRAYLAARAARQKLYEDAVRTAGDTAYGNGPFYETIAKAVVAVADAEQALLLARIAEVEAAPADRAAVLQEAAATMHTRAKHLTGEYNDSGILHEDGPAAAVATWKRAGDLLSRMADEAQS